MPSLEFQPRLPNIDRDRESHEREMNRVLYGIRPAETDDVRPYARRMLEAAFTRAELITAITVGPTGEPVTEVSDWWSYWRPIRQLEDTRIARACIELRRVWENYIRSGFRSDLVAQYCRAYFAMLDGVLRVTVRDRIGEQRALAATKATVAFECFAIGERCRRTLAAATTTLRNPAYMLARAKWPDVRHSTRFLPLITPPGDGSDTYGHYRRQPLSEDGDLSLLVYPRNRPGGDARSLGALAALANRLNLANDPYVTSRSQRMWEHIFLPLAEHHISTPNNQMVDFIDIGSGTGALAAALCQKFLSWASRREALLRFRIALIDNGGAATSNTFREEPLRSAVEALARIPADYKAWLTSPMPVPSRRGLRFGLACKTLNTSSAFDLQTFRPDELPQSASDAGWFDPERRSPTACLSGNSNDRDSLLVSTSRFEVEDGHGYALAALSDYFAALASIDGAVSMEGAVCLPVRRFDPRALITVKGTSVLVEMLRPVDYVVIEDVDLRPRDLLAHLRSFQLTGICAQDLTTAMGLAGNYAFVLWRDTGSRPPLEGESLA